MLYTLLTTLEQKGLLPEGELKSSYEEYLRDIDNDIISVDGKDWVTVQLLTALRDPKIEEALGENNIITDSDLESTENTNTKIALKAIRAVLPKTNAQRLRHNLVDGRPVEEVIEETLQILNGK